MKIYNQIYHNYKKDCYNTMDSNMRLLDDNTKAIVDIVVEQRAVMTLFNKLIVKIDTLGDNITFLNTLVTNKHIVANIPAKNRIANKSPLRYPGGKTRACKIIYDALLRYFDINSIKTLYSPFIGGASFEFYLQSKIACNIVANDKFSPLYVFWNSCKKDNAKLCTELYKITDVSKDMFSTYRQSIMTETNLLTQSRDYFIINRCSFSGATLSGGYSKQAAKKRFTLSSIDRVNKLNLTKFDIYNKDFSDFIVGCTETNSLIFLDPPYYLDKNSKLYGFNGDMHETFDHKKLYDAIKEKSNWIITYNNCKYIRDLYKQFLILNVEWSYGMNASKQSSEIIIINPKR